MLRKRHVIALFVIIAFIYVQAGGLLNAKDNPSQKTQALKVVSHAERRILLRGSMGRKARELYVLGTDRTTLVNLMPPDEKGDVGQASWSPDGNKITFILKKYSDRLKGDVYVVNSDGTGHINLTNSADLHENGIFWSPDGTQIAFFRYVDDDNLHVSAVNGNATNVGQQITLVSGALQSMISTKSLTCLR